MELIKALLLVWFIVIVLVVALCLLSGRRGHGLNSHMEMPDPRDALRHDKEEDAAASEFFDKVEDFRHDFA